MHPDCLLEISRVVGRKITDEEARAYEDAIDHYGRQLARENPAEWRGKSLGEKAVAAAERAQAEAVSRANKVAQRKLSNLIAQARESQHLDMRAPAMRGPAKHHAALFERMRQVDSYLTGVKHEALASVIDAIHAVEPKFFNLFENPDAVRAFARAVYGDDSGSAIINRATKSYLEAVEGLRARANAAGADIGKLDYGYLPQPHDVGRIARSGRDAWVDFIAPLIRRDRYINEDGTPMTEAQVLDTLRAAYDTLSTEGRNKMLPGQSGRGSRAARFDEAHRVIHFRNADSHLQYLAEFGRGSMMEAITGHIGMMGKNIGLMEQFGANPNATFRLLKDLTEKADNVAGGRESGATLDMVWDTLNGTTAQPVSANLAAAGQGVRNFVTATKLQGVMLSSITDAPLMALAAHHNGMPVSATIANALRSFGGNTRNEATRLGLAMDSITSEMAQWHTDNLAQGWTGKLANTTMRATLVESWTHALRRGFSLTLSARLGDMVKTDWQALKAFDRERMAAAGVTAADWKLWQQAQLTEVNGQQLLTRDGLRALDADATAINRATARLIGFLDAEAKMAVLAPDLMTRAAITQGTRTGTWGGELTRSLMLFKSFPMAMVVQHLRRIRSLPTTGSKVQYSVAMMASLTMFGALAMQLKELAAGRDPRDMTAGKFWVAAFVQGGGVGVFGDILYTGMGGNTRSGQANWTSLMGPVFGTGADALNVTIGNLGQAMQGKKTHAGAEVLRFAKGNTPFVNLWYARSAIDHLFLHELQEEISPGYLRQMRERARKDFHQDYWWRPGDKLPDRAPDLEAAVGE